jgi:hypothetical protein
MANDDALIKTSLRISRGLHAEIEKAADASGLTLNAEMIVRLQHDPRESYAKAILEEIRRRDSTIVAVMWSALERADNVLARVETAMALVNGEGEPAQIKREVEFARQLIGAIAAHR